MGDPSFWHDPTFPLDPQSWWAKKVGWNYFLTWPYFFTWPSIMMGQTVVLFRALVLELYESFSVKKCPPPKFWHGQKLTPTIFWHCQKLTPPSIFWQCQKIAYSHFVWEQIPVLSTPLAPIGARQPKWDITWRYLDGLRPSKKPHPLFFDSVKNWPPPPIFYLT